MSLEHPGPGFCELYSTGCDSISLFAVEHFVRGFCAGAEKYGHAEPTSSWLEFREWLRENGHLPCKGWAKKIVDECGDGEAAINRFVELLYQHLERKKPNWFIEFNSQPQPSRWKKAHGVPRSSDIRKSEHVEIKGK